MRKYYEIVLCMIILAQNYVAIRLNYFLVFIPIIYIYFHVILNQFRTSLSITKGNFKINLFWVLNNKIYLQDSSMLKATSNTNYLLLDAYINPVVNLSLL